MNKWMSGGWVSEWGNKWERGRKEGEREREISKLMRDPVFTAIAIIDIKKKKTKKYVALI